MASPSRWAPPAARRLALVARQVGSITLGLHAHKRYLERRGVPSTLEDLSRHDLIGFDVETPFIRAAMKHLPGVDRSMFALRVDNDAAQLAAIKKLRGR